MTSASRSRAREMRSAGVRLRGTELDLRLFADDAVRNQRAGALEGDDARLQRPVEHVALARGHGLPVHLAEPRAHPFDVLAPSPRLDGCHGGLRWPPQEDERAFPGPIDLAQRERVAAST